MNLTSMQVEDFTEMDGSTMDVATMVVDVAK